MLAVLVCNEKYVSYRHHACTCSVFKQELLLLLNILLLWVTMVSPSGTRLNALAIWPNSSKIISSSTCMQVPRSEFSEEKMGTNSRTSTCIPSSPLGLDKLFLFSYLLFYSHILKKFTYYSFQATHYSFYPTYFSQLLLNFNGRVWPERPSYLALLHYD